MQKYLDYHYDGPAFELFGAGHLLAVSIVAGTVAFLIRVRPDPDEAAKRRARLLMAGILLALEASWHGWNLIHGAWNVQQNLPLHACSISSWCTIYILLTRSYRVYEIIYFVGIAGAAQAVLTPDAGIYGLPHFRAVQTLALHGMIVIAMVYMTTIEGFRPTWSSVWKTVLVGNLFLLFVAGVNYLIGSNYMYTRQKPATSSLLDILGPWPWYLLAGELVAVMLVLLLYLPFALADRRARRSDSAAAS